MVEVERWAYILVNAAVLPPVTASSYRLAFYPRFYPANINLPVSSQHTCMALSLYRQEKTLFLGF